MYTVHCGRENWSQSLLYKLVGITIPSPIELYWEFFRSIFGFTLISEKKKRILINEGLGIPLKCPLYHGIKSCVEVGYVQEVLEKCV